MEINFRFPNFHGFGNPSLLLEQGSHDPFPAALLPPSRAYPVDRRIGYATSSWSPHCAGWSIIGTPREGSEIGWDEWKS